jgi:S1-C subfamily serine protease
LKVLNNGRQFRPRRWAIVFALSIATWGSSGWSLTTEERATIEVYRRASQGVVHIRSVVVRYNFFFQAFPTEGMGSGVVIDKDGHIVTNAHVIRDAESLEVTLADGSRWKARLVGDLPNYDLAVIHIDAPAGKLAPLTLGSTEVLRIGQKVLAIGNPFGFQQTLTKGVVSSMDRTLVSPNGKRLEGLIQTDAAINPGNSGGPLLDYQGTLIGINTAILSPTGGNIGVGFAIPVESVKRHLPRLVRGDIWKWINGLLALAGFAILLWLFVSRSRKGPRW